MAAIKSDLKVVMECLSMGIPLDLLTRKGIRHFRSGDFTGGFDRGWAISTHHDDNGNQLAFGPKSMSSLAAQARDKLARKEEILTQQKHDHAIAMGRD